MRKNLHNMMKYQNGGHTTVSDTIRTPNILNMYPLKSGVAPDYVLRHKHTTYKEKPKEEGWFSKTLDKVDDVLSAPQRAVTYALTGKYQNPSEALGIENKWGKIAADMILDPMNLIPIASVTKALKFLKVKRLTTTAAEAAEGMKRVDDNEAFVEGIKGATKTATEYAGKNYDDLINIRKKIFLTDDYIKYYKKYDETFKHHKINTMDFTKLVKDEKKFLDFTKTSAGAALINDLIRQSGEYEATTKYEHIPHYPPQPQSEIKTVSEMTSTFKTIKKSRPSDPVIAKKQEQLKKEGLYTGPIDGLWGEQSEEAWKKSGHYREFTDPNEYDYYKKKWDNSKQGKEPILKTTPQVQPEQIKKDTTGFDPEKVFWTPLGKFKYEDLPYMLKDKKTHEAAFGKKTEFKKGGLVSMMNRYQNGGINLPRYREPANPRLTPKDLMIPEDVEEDDMMRISPDGIHRRFRQESQENINSLSDLGDIGDGEIGGTGFNWKMNKQYQREEERKLRESGYKLKSTHKDKGGNSFNIYQSPIKDDIDVEVYDSPTFEKIPSISPYVQTNESNKDIIDPIRVAPATKYKFAENELLQSYTLADPKRWGYYKGPGGIDKELTKEEFKEYQRRGHRAGEVSTVAGLKYGGKILPKYQNGGEIDHTKLFGNEGRINSALHGMDYGKYIQDPVRREEHIKNVLWSVMDNNVHDKDTIMDMFNQISGYGSTRGGIADEGNIGFDYSDVDEGRISSYMDEYYKRVPEKRHIQDMHSKGYTFDNEGFVTDIEPEGFKKGGKTNLLSLM